MVIRVAFEAHLSVKSDCGAGMLLNATSQKSWFLGHCRETCHFFPSTNHKRETPNMSPYSLSELKHEYLVRWL